MTISSIRDKFLHFLDKSGDVLTKGSVELHLHGEDDKLKSASLIFPPLRPISEDSICGSACATMFLFLFLGPNIDLPRWLDHAISKFRPEKVYDEHHSGFDLRLSSTDRMYHLTVLLP